MASSAEVRHSRLPWPETTGTPLTGPAALRQAGVLTCTCSALFSSGTQNASRSASASGDRPRRLRVCAFSGVARARRPPPASPHPPSLPDDGEVAVVRGSDVHPELHREAERPDLRRGVVPAGADDPGARQHPSLGILREASQNLDMNSGAVQATDSSSTLPPSAIRRGSATSSWPSMSRANDSSHAQPGR